MSAFNDNVANLLSYTNELRSASKVYNYYT